MGHFTVSIDHVLLIGLLRLQVIGGHLEITSHVIKALCVREHRSESPWALCVREHRSESPWATLACGSSPLDVILDQTFSLGSKGPAQHQ